MAGFSYKNSYDNYWDYAYDMFLGSGGGGGGGGNGATANGTGTGTAAGAAGAALGYLFKEWIKGNTKWNGTKWINPDKETDDLPGAIDIPETGNDLPGTIDIPETGNDLPGTIDIPKEGTIDIPKEGTIDIPKEGTIENTGVKPLTGIFSETGSWLGLIPGLTQDKTNDNIEMSLKNEDVMSLIKGLRDEQWTREDAIRKETQSREDNAWERAVADMNRAGVNANLVNAGPAESGGGITNATGADTNVLSTQLQNETSLLKQFIDQNFQGNEKAKDRLITLITSIIQVSGHMAVAELFKKK